MIDVYIATLPDKEPCDALLCAKRQADIDKISNERVRREKYYVWKLLEYAIKYSLGADASRLCFTKGENQRWSCDDFEFSLSHSGDALAVALSNRAVGVDVERVRVKNSERMSNYILTQNECNQYAFVDENDKAEWLISKWCQKEAIFKSQNESVFSPSKIETSEFFCFFKKIELGKEKYILSVATKEYDDVNVIEFANFNF